MKDKYNKLEKEKYEMKIEMLENNEKYLKTIDDILLLLK